MALASLPLAGCGAGHIAETAEMPFAAVRDAALKLAGSGLLNLTGTGVFVKVG